MMYFVFSLLYFVSIVQGQTYQTYLIGDHPDATHYMHDRSDIYNITQTLLNILTKNPVGGRITIANGTYILSMNIQMGSNTHLNGFGMYETILQLADFAPKFARNGFVRTVTRRNIMITNLTLDGNKHRQIIDGVDNDLPKNIAVGKSTRYGRYGLYTEGCVNVTFDGLRTMNFQGYGLYLQGQKKTGTYGDGVVIKNCLATHNNWDGFAFDQSNNIYIFNCTVRSNGRHGINVLSGTRAVIENSTSFVDGYYYPTGSGCGVQVESNRVTIRNMLIIDPKKGGICINGVSNANITNNKLYGKTCFRIETSVNVTVNNNTCYNSNPSTRFVMNTKNTNIVISKTLNLTDVISTYSGQNLTIVVGYSDATTIKARRGRDAYYVFQQAFDEIKANGRGKLYIEEGEYILSSFLEVGDNVTVIGAGLNKTVLKLQDFARPWWIPGTGTKRSGFLRSTWCNNLNFYNLTINGNKHNQNTDKYSQYGRFGFFTEACDNVYVDGMGIVNFQGYGFDPHGVKHSKTWSINLTIINSYSGHNDWDGYTIDQSANVLLRNNIAYNNGRHGFNIVTGTYNILIENNTAYGNGYYYYQGNEGCGIAVQNNLKYGTHNATVRNNTLIHSKDAGICVNDVYNIVVANNTIVRNNTIVCVKSVLVVNGTLVNNECLGLSVKTPTPKQPKSPSPQKPKSNGNITTTSLFTLMICVIISFIM